MKTSYIIPFVLLFSGAAPARAPVAPAAAPAVARDGSRDFDFQLGAWHTSIRRFRNVFSANPQVIEMTGKVTTRPVWGGKGVLEEIETEGPEGRWQALTLFLYNPETRQWRQSFANSRDGVLQPPTIGSFADNRGVLVAQDVLGSRSILVKSVWSDIRPNSHRYQEFYSDDAGQTWHIAFSAVKTRLSR